MLLSYDWISVPLTYTQVVNLAVRFYFAICLVSRQYVGGAARHYDDAAIVDKSPESEDQEFPSLHKVSDC